MVVGTYEYWHTLKVLRHHEHIRIVRPLVRHGPDRVCHRRVFFLSIVTKLL
jgi:hypothetical protein